VIGAGPAGLTAAYELGRLGMTAVVLERDEVVGGLSRTCEYRGYRFDIGGHRFFTKVAYVRELWEEILGDEFLVRPRLSRIFYRGHFFAYPLKPVNALLGLGPVEALRIVASFLRAQALPSAREETFEQWVCNRFGRRLFEIFFKTYTEKVWGIPCSEIRAEWAAQRIKNLDLAAAIRNAILRSGSSDEVITTLIDRFHYPRHGPGQMWERCAERLERMGTKIVFGARVMRLTHDGSRIRSAWVRDGNPAEYEVRADHFLSSMPIRELVCCLDPPPPPEVIDAANRLRYRDFLTVALIVDQPDLFPDNWIYIHSDQVKVGRIQNFKNWSPDMVPDPSTTALGLEYFVQEDDELWSLPDAELIDLGRRECAALGLASPGRVVDGTVLRVRKAYPVYDGDYPDALRTVRGWLERFSNLHAIGRNGQHRYNNQDHSMMTGVYAARNVAGASYDVFAVNVDQEYLEEGRAGAGDRLVPERVEGETLEALIRDAFARYDPVALGTALGSVLGLGLFLATALLLLRGGEPLGPNLSLLGNYLFGYSVTWGGAFLGLCEAAAGGFGFGYVLARLMNWTIHLEEAELLDRIEAMQAMDLLEGDDR